MTNVHADVEACEHVHLRVTQLLVVDLIQDDHPIRGLRFHPGDVYCFLCHLAFDETQDVIGFVCGEQNDMSHICVKSWACLE